MAADDLDLVVRRADPDRWLASRFIADRRARADVVALYAFDHELARVRRLASNALLAEIRLAWWREALDEVFAAGPVRAHPVARALAQVVARRDLPRAPLEAMIDARIAVLDEARSGPGRGAELGGRRGRVGGGSRPAGARFFSVAGRRGAGRPGVGTAAAPARRRH